VVGDGGGNATFAFVWNPRNTHPMTHSLTAILIREDDGFVALCPEVDVASQGETVEDAKKNLQEAVELFFECASPQEVAERLSSESFVSSLEVNVA
jgi:predicted RNase H-like HicB family nuclease